MQIWMLMWLMNERMWRRQYAEERQTPEWFDLGGEA